LAVRALCRNDLNSCVHGVWLNLLAYWQLHPLQNVWKFDEILREALSKWYSMP